MNSSAREQVHTRTIDYDVLADPRADVRVDAKLCDLRRIRFMSTVGGRVMRPGVVHDVELAMTAGSDGRIRASEFHMYTVPFAEGLDTGGVQCRDIEPAFDRLAGIVVDDGYVRAVTDRVGGPRGCFHGLALAIGAGPVIRQAAGLAERDGRRLRFARNILVDGYRYGETGVTLAGRLQDASAVAGPLEGPAPLGDVQREVELELSFEVGAFVYHSVQAAVRGPDGIADETAARAAEALHGVVSGPGVFATARARLGGAPGGGLLLELLSMMIPVTTQAALAQLRRAGLQAPGTGGSIAQLDSCHMWATDGALVARLRAAEGLPGGKSE